MRAEIALQVGNFWFERPLPFVVLPPRALKGCAQQLQAVIMVDREMQAVNKVKKMS